MSSAEEAQKAIEMFNGQDFGGRSLAVNEARPKTEGPRITSMRQPCGLGWMCFA
jgi:RNA recognition motif-containing protein